MTFNPDEDYNDDRIVLTVEGEFQGYAIEAHSSPDSEGRTFIDGGDEEIGEVTKHDRYGAPFAVDLVFVNNVYPMEGEIDDIRDEVGSSLEAQFDGKVDNVFEKISDAEDPFDEIMDLDAKEL